LLERAGECRRYWTWRFISQQKELLTALKLAYPWFTWQLPSACKRRYDLQEHQLIDHFGVDSLGDAQRFLGQG
jgi:hypothetical protein